MAFFTNMSRSEGDPKVLRSGPSSLGSSDRLAHNLGWFSIGLGLFEILAAEKITGAFGVRGNEVLVRVFGVREIASGVMTLSVDKQAGLASRVAGDALDIATLATVMRSDNHKRENAALALAMVAGIAFLDIIAMGASAARHTSYRGQRRNYGDRSGFPKGVEASRGTARKQLEHFRPPSGSAGRTAKNPTSAGDG
ncbi:hypothetical protein [Mycoplana dimorpha]|uniref:Uncharacterized protein n=1 Tax=Mycoplana dimorpha TaxID=28320 RepID=A0A2T5B8T6_MYCDI|nr:hypothetical protein [Mycoplana dimorpha]PTM95364.1 hypothetical protein C7449_104443 [Mycoplana dimorpha]